MTIEIVIRGSRYEYEAVTELGSVPGRTLVRQGERSPVFPRRHDHEAVSAPAVSRPQALALLRQGKSAREVVKEVWERDPDPDTTR